MPSPILQRRGASPPSRFATRCFPSNVFPSTAFVFPSSSESRVNISSSVAVDDAETTTVDAVDAAADTPFSSSNLPPPSYSQSLSLDRSFFVEDGKSSTTLPTFSADLTSSASASSLASTTNFDDEPLLLVPSNAVGAATPASSVDYNELEVDLRLNRIMKSTSIFVVLFVVVVVIFSGFNGATVSSTTSLGVLEAIDASGKKPSLVRAEDRNPAQVYVLTRKDLALELSKRKRLEGKLEEAMKKRNRILDILMKQQNQQTLILDRQKEILQILNKRKRR